jgi:tetratricopeptide (TPR) repeat protein
MVYVIAELRNYRQLTRLRAKDLANLEDALTAALDTHVARPVAAGQGVWAAELGPEDDIDPVSAAIGTARFRDLLLSLREQLFGFAVLIASLASSPPDPSDLRRLLEEAEEDDQIWITPACAGLFEESLVFEASGAVYKVTGLRQAAPRREIQAEAPRIGARRSAPRISPPPWTREALVDRALELLGGRINSGESRDILWVKGPQGVGTTGLVADIAARLRRDPGTPWLRMRTIFKRRSPLHPFLSTLQPQVIRAVTGALRGPEKEVWADVGGLLAWLQDPTGRENQGVVRPLPDHILEDFRLGYRLYLLAWIREAEKALSPAIFVCEGVDAYHPAARRIVGQLLDELLANPVFIPIVTSSSAQAPDELSGLTLVPLYVHHLGKREIRSLARHVFPGLAIPASLARILHHRAGGLSVSVISYLQYLAKTGHIKPQGEGFTWVQDPQEEIVVPANPLSVSWFLIRELRSDTFLFLYSLYLAAGLLDRQGFQSFLADTGFDAPSVDRSFADLISSGLVADESELIPLFPALRRKLEDLLGKEGVSHRGRFITYMMGLWTSGRYRHPVLLFTFLARNGRTDLALRILPDIIRRKLDEWDPAGAVVFCDLRSLDFATPPTPEQARELAAVVAMGRLRAALMQQDAAAAEAAQAEARKWASTDAPVSLRGEVGVERAKYFLSTGNAGAALEELKKGLLLAQESRPEAPDSSSAERADQPFYLWLGATMLAEGRLGEAVEYLGMSQRLCQEADDAQGFLWTLAYLAVSCFISGRYTQCFTVLEQGLSKARAIFRREVELFLEFLRARTLFQVGSYEECSLCLQSCLCLATIYDRDDALPVLRAWLGRTLLHQGENASGTRLLESLSRQTREVLLFQAEGCLFSGALENASLYVERGLGLAPGFRFPSPEGVPWQDGFACAEGRCFRLSRGDAFLRRTLAGLRAYLLGLRGFREEAIRELRQLTRGEKAVEEDPAVFWLNYLYSQVLPEAGAEEVDDKVTVLSKSLKSLQERASRIDAPAERSSFLWRNRWNKMIMDEARDRKLV